MGEAVPVAAIGAQPTGEQVAVYQRIGTPPSFVGGENAIVNWLSPGVIAPMIGAPGTVAPGGSGGGGGGAGTETVKPCCTAMAAL